VEFVLRNGVTVQMRAHRLGRPFKIEPKPDYGIFNGRFAGGVALGMLPPAVRELLGAPKRVAPVAPDNPNRTVEVYEYDTFSLEFDRLPTDSVVLGGIILNAPS
jgi:sugar (pentulose or hexulose) kinase